MLKYRRHRLWNYVDQLTVGNLLMAFAFLTFGPAAGYFILSTYYPGNGLVSPDPDPIGALDAIYFSVITETTLGYGDIRPVGLSRLVASFQVLLGLLLGGISVAKLTSNEGRELPLAASMTSGDWIEPCQMSDGLLMISFSRIYLGVNGLRYDGENFNSNGEPLGFFEGNLIDSDGAFMRFRYSNRESSRPTFPREIQAIDLLPMKAASFGRGITLPHTTSEPRLTQTTKASEHLTKKVKSFMGMTSRRGVSSFKK